MISYNLCGYDNKNPTRNIHFNSAHRVNNIEGEAEDLVANVDKVQTSLSVVKGRLLNGGVYPGCIEGCFDCVEAVNGCDQLKWRSLL